MGMYDGDTPSWVVERDRLIGAVLAAGESHAAGVAGLFRDVPGRGSYGNDPPSWVVKRDRLIGAQTASAARAR